MYQKKQTMTGRQLQFCHTSILGWLMVKSSRQKIKSESVHDLPPFFLRENLISKDKMKTEPKAITLQNTEIL